MAQAISQNLEKELTKLIDTHGKQFEKSVKTQEKLVISLGNKIEKAKAKQKTQQQRKATAKPAQKARITETLRTVKAELDGLKAELVAAKEGLVSLKGSQKKTIGLAKAIASFEREFNKGIKAKAKTKKPAAKKAVAKKAATKKVTGRKTAVRAKKATPAKTADIVSTEQKITEAA